MTKPIEGTPSPESAGSYEEQLVISSGGHTHVITAVGSSPEEAATEVARHGLASLMGIPAEELKNLVNPPEVPMTVKQVEEKWVSFGAALATPLSKSSIQRFIEREIAQRKQNGTLLKE